jgi:hypothetical protein
MLMNGEVPGFQGRRFTSKEAYQELGKIMGLGERDATRAGFDAVRYPYVGSEAWMIPNTTPMKSPQGVPLNIAAGGVPSTPATTLTPDLEVSGPTRRPPIPRSRGARAAAAPTMQAQSPSTLSSAVSITPGVETTPSVPSIPVTPTSTPKPTILSTGQQPPRLVKPEKKMSVAELMSVPSNLTPEQEAVKKKLMEDIKKRMNK